MCILKLKYVSFVFSQRSHPPRDGILNTLDNDTTNTDGQPRRKNQSEKRQEQHQDSHARSIIPQRSENHSRRRPEERSNSRVVQNTHEDERRIHSKHSHSRDHTSKIISRHSYDAANHGDKSRRQHSKNITQINMAEQSETYELVRRQNEREKDRRIAEKTGRKKDVGRRHDCRCDIVRHEDVNKRAEMDFREIISEERILRKSNTHGEHLGRQETGQRDSRRVSFSHNQVNVYSYNNNKLSQYVTMKFLQ